MSLKLSSKATAATASYGRMPVCYAVPTASRIRSNVTPSAGRSGLHVAASLAQGVAPAFEKQQAELFKGWGVPQKGSKLQQITYKPDPLGPLDIDIAVTHNGLCHTDIHMRDDDWGASKFPFVPGHEVVGTVKAKGAEVKGLEIGERVGVGWIKDSCRCCLNCLRGEENICIQGYTGLITMGGNGGFQPVMRAPSAFTYRIPEGLDSASAAPLLCAGITVYSPLRKHITRPGMRVAVLGIGGLGHLALQFAAGMGAKVTAINAMRDGDKEAECRGFGATQCVIWENITAESLGAEKFDVLINCVPVAIDSAKALSLLQTDGVFVQCGIPGGGAQITLPLQDLVFNQKKMAGSIVGGRADMQEMLNFAAAKGIKPQVQLMPLSQVNEAFEKVAKGMARYRIVLETD